MGYIVELRFGPTGVCYVDTKLDEISRLPKAIMSNGILFLPVSTYVYEPVEYFDAGDSIGKVTLDGNK